jgi:cell division septum initiation protein DivIVA
LTKRVQALVKENEKLRDQVKELEKGWKKIEKALGGNVTRARRAVKREAKAATKRVTKALG